MDGWMNAYHKSDVEQDISQPCIGKERAQACQAREAQALHKPER